MGQRAITREKPMFEYDTNDSVPKRGILTTHPAQHDDGQRRGNRPTLPKEVIVSVPGSDTLTEYTFEVTGNLEKLEPNEDSGSAADDVTDRGNRVRVEGAVGSGDDRFAFSGTLIEVDVPPEVQLDIRDRNQKTPDEESPDKGSSDWREGYQKYAQEYVPAFYRSVPTKQNLYRCVRYVAKTTNFWETLGKKMSLGKAIVTAAYAYPVPNYRKVESHAWDGILSDMYADMPKKYRKKKTYPVTVPVVVVYLYDGYYNAVAYLRPYGSGYTSYGYAIKNGYQQQTRYTSKADYKTNTWWWTEHGWGDGSNTDGGILDGVPTGLTE